MTQVATIEPEELDLTPIGLTPAQTAAWQDTMSLMAWTAPGFRHLFYKLLCNNKGAYGAVPTKGVPIAATDAKNILINPDAFFKMNLKERVFVMGHEIVHNMYNDVEFLKQCQTRGTVPMNDGTSIEFRNSTMQKAMDFRINALLRDSRIGAVPAGVLLDDTISTANESVTEVYRKVYEDEENGGQKTGKYQGFDLILAPGTSNGTQGQPRNQQQWQVEVQAAALLEAMKSQGRGNGALQRCFDSILNPIIPWTDHIRGIFNRKVGSGSFNWKRPDRRMIVRDIFMPSRSGNGAGWIVCWGDTSGSISPEEMRKYCAELSGIIEDCCPQRLTMVWCDDSINRVDEFDSGTDLAEVDPIEGCGGGTDCTPVFDWISDHVAEKPDVFIGFTDGHVTFPPTKPDVETIIWAMTTEQDAPYGDIVRINPKQ